MQNNKTNQSNHWAMTVSQYLIKRREQTYQAYHQDYNQDDNQGNDTTSNHSVVSEPLTALFAPYANTLFQTLLLILADELEQGNTVLRLSESPNHWQAVLLDKLLLELRTDYDYLWKDEVSSLTLDNLLILQKSLFNNPEIEQDSKHYLNKKLALAIECYHFFNDFNQLCPDDSSRLSIFVQQLLQSPLIILENDLQQNKEKNAPIVLSLSLYNADCYKENDDKADCYKEEVYKKSDDKNNPSSELTLWLHRSWQAEQSIIKHIYRLNQAQPTPLDLTKINQNRLRQEQLSAIETANQSAFSIITGGPGTGKTYTVAQLVIALHHANELAKQQGKKQLSLILTAPTGKAAQRMQESLKSALDTAGVSMNLQESKTIHRLLGIGRTGIPRYSMENPLAEDVIIVDEASMLGVELANYLLSSVKTGARLILLGDSHQLSAVEAGSVLADLCSMSALQEVHATLMESRRFDDNSAVGQLASLINQPSCNSMSASDSMDESVQALQHLAERYPHDLHLYVDMDNDVTTYPQLSYPKLSYPKLSYPKLSYPQSIYQRLIDCYQDYFTYTQALRSLDVAIDTEHLFKLIEVFNRFRILTAGHHGHYGDERINEVLSHYHRRYLKLPPSQSDWYHGRPVMVRKNNYGLGLFNGDIGICVAINEGLAVYFEGKDKPMAVNMLANLQASTAYAMTVHKSQGSEFNHVAVMLGEERLLSRELLYTAVTRAKQTVSIYGSLPLTYKAMSQPTVRQTGLKLR